MKVFSSKVNHGPQNSSQVDTIYYDQSNSSDEELLSKRRDMGKKRETAVKTLDEPEASDHPGKLKVRFFYLIKKYK